MKTLILPALALAALTGSALAQTPPAPNASAPPPPPPSAAPSAPVDMGDAPPPPPPGAPGAMADDAGGPPPGGPRGQRPPPPPPSRAAHFHLGRGDTIVDVKCAEDESMKACADLALQLLDHLQAPARN